MTRSKNISVFIKKLKKEALDIYNEDIECCKKIGKYGAELLKDGYTVLTHCNAGGLCAVEYGTALAPVYEASKNGKRIKVYADETRPLMQGARLTAYELKENGIDVTVICDNMAASLMAAKKINIIIVGCDRVAENGDVANKIGTLSLAINAKYFNVPFFVATPYSTIDRNIKKGSDIEIEMRDGKEISEYWFSSRITPEGVKEYNPAFDITPSKLITGYITEKGVFYSIKAEGML